MTEPSKSPVRIVAGPPLTKAVPLTWHYEHEGKTWTEVTVRRLTVGEIDAYADAVRAAKEAKRREPDIPMLDCPDELLAGMLPDDRDALEAAINDFLPRELRAEPPSTPAAAPTP